MPPGRLRRLQYKYGCCYPRPPARGCRVKAARHGAAAAASAREVPHGKPSRGGPAGVSLRRRSFAERALLPSFAFFFFASAGCAPAHRGRAAAQPACGNRWSGASDLFRVAAAYPGLARGRAYEVGGSSSRAHSCFLKRPHGPSSRVVKLRGGLVERSCFCCVLRLLSAARRSPGCAVNRLCFRPDEFAGTCPRRSRRRRRGPLFYCSARTRRPRPRGRSAAALCTDARRCSGIVARSPAAGFPPRRSLLPSLCATRRRCCDLAFGGVTIATPPPVSLFPPLFPGTASAAVFGPRTVLTAAGASG